jgi:hypothetical protein
MAQVFWAARDLDGMFAGNHSFILVYLNQNESLIRTKSESENGTKFATLGGHQKDGNLIFIPNQKADVDCVKEVLNPSLAGFWSDFDMEENRINPPSGSGWSFAIKLEELAYKYESNTASKIQEYGLLNFNCATWVNTLLKVAGVPQSERIKNGEFSGIDWGEEDLLDENLFK